MKTAEEILKHLRAEQPNTNTRWLCNNCGNDSLQLTETSLVEAGGRTFTVLHGACTECFETNEMSVPNDERIPIKHVVHDPSANWVPAPVVADYIRNKLKELDQIKSTDTWHHYFTLTQCMDVGDMDASDNGNPSNVDVVYYFFKKFAVDLVESKEEELNRLLIQYDNLGEELVIDITPSDNYESVLSSFSENVHYSYGWELKDFPALEEMAVIARLCGVAEPTLVPAIIRKALL